MPDESFEVPIGYIETWAGSRDDIPKGWVVCDGSNGTMDLMDASFPVPPGIGGLVEGIGRVTFRQTEGRYWPIMKVKHEHRDG